MVLHLVPVPEVVPTRHTVPANLPPLRLVLGQETGARPLHYRVVAVGGHVIGLVLVLRRFLVVKVIRLLKVFPSTVRERRRVKSSDNTRIVIPRRMGIRHLHQPLLLPEVLPVKAQAHAHGRSRLLVLQEVGGRAPFLEQFADRVESTAVKQVRLCAKFPLNRC